MRALSVVIAWALIVSPGTAFATLVAGPITNPANGHSYYLLSFDTWSASEAEAVTLGGHLVTIDDAAEDAFVLTTFGPFIPDGAALWIGLNDAAAEGTFEWVDGTPVTYTNWSSGEPNDLNGEDYVHIIVAASDSRNGEWNDILDSGFGGSGVFGNPHGVVEVVPESSALILVTSAFAALAIWRRCKG